MIIELNPLRSEGLDYHTRRTPRQAEVLVDVREIVNGGIVEDRMMSISYGPETRYCGLDCSLSHTSP